VSTHACAISSQERRDLERRLCEATEAGCQAAQCRDLLSEQLDAARLEAQQAQAQLEHTGKVADRPCRAARRKLGRRGIR
jgi:hypothetical protein